MRSVEAQIGALRDQLRSLGGLVEGARASLRGMLLRGVVRLVTETTGLRTIQVSLRAGETDPAVEHVEPYGLTAKPGAGAECLTARVGAAADHPVVLVSWSRAYRPTDLEDWEVAVYNRWGKEVRLEEDRVAVTGNTEVTGYVSATGGFKVGGVAGKSGTFTDAGSGNTLIFAGGILVGGTGVP